MAQQITGIPVHLVPCGVHRPLVIQTSQCVVQYPVRLISEYEQEQLRGNDGVSLYYPKGTEEFPRINMAGIALAWKESSKPNTNEPGSIKVPVFTALNGIVPRARAIALLEVNTFERAELHRLQMQRELRFQGVALHETNGSILKGTGTTGSLAMTPCIISGSCTIQTTNRLRVPFLPGDRVRWLLPPFENKANNAKWGFTKSVPQMYEACPGLVFPELEKVTRGTPAEGHTAVAYPMALIKAADNPRMDDLLVHCVEVKALTRILFDTKLSAMYRRMLVQCLAVIQHTESAYHLYDQLLTMDIPRDAAYKLISPAPLVALPGTGINIDRTSIQDMPGAAVDTKHVRKVRRLRPVEHLPALYRRYFHTLAYNPGDVIVAQTPNAAGNWGIPIFEVNPILQVPLDTFRRKNTTWNQHGPMTEERKTAQLSEAIRLNLHILQAMYNYNNTRRPQSVRLYVVTKDLRTTDPCYIEECSPTSFQHWCSGLVANMDELKADMMEREIGTVINDNCQGSITVVVAAGGGRV